MSEFTDLLDQIPVPEHHPDFWTNLEQELEGAPTPIIDTEPHLVDPRTDEDVSLGEDTDLDTRRRSRRQLLVAITAVAAAILAFVLGIGALTEDSGPGPVVTEPTPPPSLTVPPTPTAISLPPDPTIEAIPGPGEGGSDDADGSDVVLPSRSAGLPISLSEDSGLTEGKTLSVTGSGFAPGAQVAVAQCYGPTNPDTESTPDIGVCDLSSYVVTNAGPEGSAEGRISTGFEPRRFITIAGQVVDCADPEPPNSCVIAAADIGDLAEFGILAIDFDPAATGAPVPILTVAPTDNLQHNQLVEVVGSGFQPGEVVHLSSCPLNPDFEPCMIQRGATRVAADSTGGFVVSLHAQQFVESMLCKPDPAFECQIAALAIRAPSPVPIRFAADPSGSTPWMTPAGPFAQGETVRFSVPLMQATPGETFEVRQCVYDPGLAVQPDSCGEPVTGTVGDDGISVELDVYAYAAEAYTAADGGTRFRYLDCQGVGSGRFFTGCEIRVETPSFVFPRFPITFLEGAGESGRQDVNDR